MTDRQPVGMVSGQIGGYKIMVEHKPLTQEERFDQWRESIPKIGIKDLVTLYGILMSLKGWEKDAALIKVEIDKRLSNVVERPETAI